MEFLIHLKKKKVICAVYDEISAISCYETIKQGYDTQDNCLL